MHRTREMAVAGLFYPDSPQALQQMFSAWFKTDRPDENASQIPRALIVPHAGYIYSGEIAAQGYQLWSEQNLGALQSEIKTVVVMGPAHRVAFEGITTVDYDALQTPLGELQINTQLRDRLLAKFDQLKVSDYANRDEHSIEVHLPFIKALLPDVQVLPLLNGMVDAGEVAALLAELWQQPGVYFVISSDLSHFHPYAEAQQIDVHTAQLIKDFDWSHLSGDQACGYKGIQGLLKLQQQLPLSIEPLALLNSGDTAGDRSRVVGYGAWAIYEQRAAQ